MKLNNKKTIFVGFAFFLICIFWQAYDTLVPKILTDKFGMSQGISGFLMSLDNIFALFLLPFFGSLSDKCRSKSGKRTPFIIAGTLIAALLIFGMAAADTVQYRKLGKVAEINNKEALEILYDYDGYETLKTPEGKQYKLTDFTKEQFVSITTDTKWRYDGDTLITENVKDNDEGVFSPHTEYVVPARQAYAGDVTKSDPSALIMFVAFLLFVLIGMSTFRSPAVALMPDVTPKPLRSKANAIINLMGALGGIIVLALGIVMATGSAKNATMPYFVFFAVISGLMLLSLFIFKLTVNEPKLVKEMKEESERYGITDDDGSDGEIEEIRKGASGLSKGKKASLIFILLSVVFWYMAYNAVTSKFSVYAGSVLQKNYNTTLIIAQAAAIVSYIPVGAIATRVGRKKTIIAGVVMLGTAFLAGAFLDATSPAILMNVFFALAGIGWATINVNSFPMAVELADDSNVGKYTGYYYTASMAAQIATPIISGFLMDQFGMKILFPYAALFSFFAIITMIFVKHGDNKAVKADK